MDTGAYRLISLQATLREGGDVAAAVADGLVLHHQWCAFTRTHAEMLSQGLDRPGSPASLQPSLQAMDKVLQEAVYVSDSWDTPGDVALTPPCPRRS